MGWFSGNSDDGSKMKVTDSGDNHKTERISSEDRPHSHDIVKIDKPSGSVKEIHIGPNAGRKGK
ncbi:TPA: hypothetical protein DCZ46_03010 [Candidatus Campbellbacteria bacterium]|nr:MAG: hypothetical protein UR74_C0002G0169 [Candidatus Campbellbacteria bacterium GW2011_GWD2_35_24]KKP75789.1 MAG: hypothetical protein UR75_C0002G0170 [Candidatus Campbellbacteria bacterium GW2011_GWC2_35_28]KKP76963.1 MAG: hypothetical protein UR76_C0002G0164 [Candidatus Campbellbacteria bacterium GW2011_GWC1_35_31]KKP78889.1 MAG: hypothetical protein UR79_C0002G0164 [Candidatus Campbellbacteria bacterium GW2011_GWD1_35_49]HAP74187.1 hypothetical protein [Candidatus Campbellbacteria bacter